MALASGNAQGQVILFSNVDGSLSSPSAYYTTPYALNSSVYSSPVYVPSSTFNSSIVTSSTLPLYVNSTIDPNAMVTASAIVQACEAQGIDPESLLSPSSSSAQASNAAAWQFLIPLIPDIVDIILGGGDSGGGGGVGGNARLDRIEAKLDLLLKKEGVETGNGNGGGAGGRSDLADLLSKLIPILLDRIGDRNDSGSEDGRTDVAIPDSFDSLVLSASSVQSSASVQSFASQTGTSVGDIQRAATALRRLQSYVSAQAEEADPEDALNNAVSDYEDAMKAVEEAALNVRRQKVLATTELKIQQLRTQAEKDIAELEGRKPENRSNPD